MGLTQWCSIPTESPKSQYLSKKTQTLKSSASIFKTTHKKSDSSLSGRGSDNNGGERFMQGLGAANEVYNYYQLSNMCATAKGIFDILQTALQGLGISAIS